VVLKVLQLIPTLDRSGAEKQMVLLATGLPRERFQVEVATLTRLGPFETELRAAGVPVTALGKRFKLDPLALVRLVQLLRAGRFDVMQTWIFAANSYGRVAARLARVPVVVTAEMAVDLWKTPRELAIDRWLAQRTDRVVGNSQAVVDFYRRQGIPAERLTLIRSGIVAEEPPPVDRAAVRAGFGWPADVSLGVFAGRLAAQKGVDDLIAAIDLLQYVLPTLRVLIVGDGPLRHQLEATAAAFRLGGIVRFTGHRDDVPQLLAAANLLILPSLYEGLPNIVLEAMQSALPVVATAAPGTTEVVVDGGTGLLVPLHDPPALAQAIRTVVESPERARLWGAAGKARVSSEFRAASMIDAYASLYEELARAKGLTQPVAAPQ
jgi:glycosyltransferase involved in cell wall biosynthesis